MRERNGDSHILVRVGVTDIKDPSQREKGTVTFSRAPTGRTLTPERYSPIREPITAEKSHLPVM